jgi:hypothetical protein
MIFIVCLLPHNDVLLYYTRWSFSISIWQFQNFDVFSQKINKMTRIYIRKTWFVKKNPNFWFKRLEKSIPQKPLTQNVGSMLNVHVTCYILFMLKKILVRFLQKPMSKVLLMWFDLHAIFFVFDFYCSQKNCSYTCCIFFYYSWNPNFIRVFHIVTVFSPFFWVSFHPKPLF